MKEIKKPSQIKRYLDKYVIGQEDAKKIMAVGVYNHYKRIEHGRCDIAKSNIMMVGPSGCGKTELARCIAQLLDVPFAIADANSITQTGYAGDDVESVLQKLLVAAGGNVKVAETGIVFIDEIDKIAKDPELEYRQTDVCGECVQQGLLKIIEGAKVEVPVRGSKKVSNVPTVLMDTSNILFICAGAFVRLDKIKKKKRKTERRTIGFDFSVNEEGKPETLLEDTSDRVTHQDLIKYGMIPEFIGRFSIIAQLKSLDRDDLKRILVEPHNSVIRQYEQLLAMDNIIVEFPEETLDLIVDNAIRKKTGARGLKSVLENAMIDVMYKAPDLRTLQRVTITPEVLTQGKEPKFEKWVYEDICG